MYKTEDEARQDTEHLMGHRENFPLCRKWFPDVPFDRNYKVMACHIEDALKSLEAKIAKIAKSAEGTNG